MKIKFDMIGLFVNNLHKMVDFYHDVIGIDIEWDREGPYAEFKHEGIRFAMYERKALQQLIGKYLSFPMGVNGSFELAINVGDPAKVDSTYHRLIANGATGIYTPRNEPWNMRSAIVTDPEGNIIEIASDFWE